MQYETVAYLDCPQEGSNVIISPAAPHQKNKCNCKKGGSDATCYVLEKKKVEWALVTDMK